MKICPKQLIDVKAEIYSQHHLIIFSTIDCKFHDSFLTPLTIHQVSTSNIIQQLIVYNKDEFQLRYFRLIFGSHAQANTSVMLTI
jgi:hypothetical protein